MRLEEFYGQLLCVRTPWNVKEVKADIAGRKVEVIVVCEEGAIWAGSNGQRLHVHDWQEREWRHLDTCQCETVIRAKVPRVIDPETGKTQTVQVPWAEKGSRWTLMFEAFAVMVLENSGTLTQAAKILRIDWFSAQAIMKRAVERGVIRRKSEEMEIVGLDEKSFARGQSYVTVMTDVAGGRVWEVSEGRDRKAVDQVWQSLPLKAREAIRAVTMDMWEPYVEGAKRWVPMAAVVFDKFHVSKHLHEAVDKVRRAEHRELGSASVLTGSKYTWLQRVEHMSRERYAQLRGLMTLKLKTARAWAYKELFAEVWQSATVEEAKTKAQAWYAKAIRSRLDPIKKVARLIRQRLDAIVACVGWRVTNASSEGFNSKIQSLKAAARGFRNFSHYRIRILFHCGKLNMTPQSP